MKIKLFLASLFITFTIVGCSQADSNDETSTTEGQVEDIRELVQDYSLGNIKPESASITSQELIVTENGNKVTHDLSDEDFFVSIAPYFDQTHP